ncbi:MAG TPA: PAS domain S-box protein [Mycobacteriales bacterium]|nr:PAS domain S-box protein [Mycobacteriales bacterium]
METDRRLRAALLPYQPRLLADVLDTLDEAVVVLGETGHVLAGNVAAARLLGVRRGRRTTDAHGSDVVSIADDAGAEVDVTDYDAWRDRALLGATCALRVRRADGTVRWVAASAQALHDDAVVCRFTDVTRRRDLERRAAQAADQAARAEIDLVAAERRVAMLEDLLAQLATKRAGEQ